jgi:hypothetical protein
MTDDEVSVAAVQARLAYMVDVVYYPVRAQTFERKVD